MKITLVKSTAVEPQSPTLHMEPETSDDQHQLRRLDNAGYLSGCGMHPTSGEYLHAQVIVRP